MPGHESSLRQYKYNRQIQMNGDVIRNERFLWTRFLGGSLERSRHKFHQHQIRGGDCQDTYPEDESDSGSASTWCPVSGGGLLSGVGPVPVVFRRFITGKLVARVALSSLPTRMCIAG